MTLTHNSLPTAASILVHDIGPLIFRGYHSNGSTFDSSHVKTLLLIGASAGELYRPPLGEIIV